MAIRLGIVGCGYWGPNLVRNFFENDHVELRYICDLVPSRLASFTKRYPNLKSTTEYADLLNDSDVDAVVIATHANSHYMLARQALLANKHVLIEKPMCANSEQCLDLIAIAEENGLILMVDHTFVYHGAVRRIKSEIDQGNVGDILYFDSVRINLGLFQNDVNVVWDLAPHDLSIMDYLLNGQVPETIQASGASHTSTGLTDIAYITLNFANGLIAHFNASWLSPVKIRQILIGGTKKMIIYDDLQPAEKVRIYNKGISVEQPKTEQSRYEQLIQYRIGDMLAPVLNLDEALKGVVQDFVGCIQQSRTPLSDGWSGYRVVSILEAVDRAIVSGHSRKLDVKQKAIRIR